MEEELKRIECLIERCNQCKLNACITCDICWSEVQAIENLLARNKELEEEVDSLVKQYEHQGAIMVNEYMLLSQIKELFVPKIKIRQQINQIKMNAEYDCIYKYDDREVIDILQELMEE